MQLNSLRAHFRHEILEFLRQGITPEQMMLVLQELKVELAVSIEYQEAIHQHSQENQ